MKYHGLITSGFIYDTAPYPECHAATLESGNGTVFGAWFGGAYEKNPDVCIYVSRHEAGGWTEPIQAADGIVDAGTRYPCWNPVLFQPHDGPLLLFYKVGPDPRVWWGMLTTSEDGGKSWSAPVRLPDGILGPIKNKPILLANGDLLCPSSTEDDGWRIHFERTADLGKTWERTEAINDGKEYEAIQPTLLLHSAGRIQALCRTLQKVVVESWSSDNGHTWTPLQATALPNPNSGFDAVTLADGRHLLVYNHTPKGRTPLNVAVSADGKDWKAALVLETEPGEYSYPAVIQSPDGLVHSLYTWNRKRIKHVVIDPAQLNLRDMPEGQWPVSDPE